MHDIGSEVKAGDLGGFVENEGNLSFEPGDTAWIFDDAIACNNALVNEGAVLRDSATACESAFVSHRAVLTAHARAEGGSFVGGGSMGEYARVSGSGMLLISQESQQAPQLSGHCNIYGRVMGDVRINGCTVILSSEDVYNDTPDILSLHDGVRSILRDPSRDELTPSEIEAEPEKPKGRGRSR